MIFTLGACVTREGSALSDPLTLREPSTLAARKIETQAVTDQTELIPPLLRRLAVSICPLSYHIH